MKKKQIQIFTLSILAGSFIIISAILTYFFNSSLTKMLPDILEHTMDIPHFNEIIYWSYGYATFFNVIAFACGAMILYTSMLVRSEPSRNTTWGVFIIVPSILSALGTWATFGLGPIFGIIAGVFTLAWKPTVPTVPTQVST